MIGAALQRFAILLMLMGGIFELNSGGTGVGIVLFALAVGAVRLVLELRPELTDA
ncbi:hypothetical protein [Natrinema sp. CBA1119]|uniref:hypothetical protein n=1 Tax=Natrinema sp. CBA1119 TaxID=1608465 RepID=UPI00159B86D7|nr:hypothetical protein [Natrinema sp. CBA1119]